MNPDDNTQGHNAAARADLIRKACREVSELDDQIAGLQTQKSEIKNKTIKGDLGMKVSDFNIALRLYKLEGNDRNTCIDTIRECFTALGIGEQGQIFPADLGPAGQYGGEMEGEPQPPVSGEPVEDISFQRPN